MKTNTNGNAYRWVGVTAVLLPALLVLAGCANVPTDPREGGLAGGVVGLQSGAYAARIQEREDRLQRLRSLQYELELEGDELEDEKARQTQSVAEARESADLLAARIEELAYAVDDLMDEQRAEDRRAQELKTRLETLQARMQEQQSGLDGLEGHGEGAAPDPEIELRRRQLEEQRESLQEEFELLLDLSLQL